MRVIIIKTQQWGPLPCNGGLCLFTTSYRQSTQVSYIRKFRSAEELFSIIGNALETIFAQNSFRIRKTWPAKSHFSRTAVCKSAWKRNILKLDAYHTSILFLGFIGFSTSVNHKGAIASLSTIKYGSIISSTSFWRPFECNEKSNFLLLWLFPWPHSILTWFYIKNIGGQMLAVQDIH